MAFTINAGGGSWRKLRPTFSGPRQLGGRGPSEFTFERGDDSRSFPRSKNSLLQRFSRCSSGPVRRSRHGLPEDPSLEVLAEMHPRHDGIGVIMCQSHRAQRTLIATLLVAGGSTRLRMRLALWKKRLGLYSPLRNLAKDSARRGPLNSRSDSKAA
jgi:hypothetical protein